MIRGLRFKDRRLRRPASKYSRLRRGPAAQALQTRIRLRGETNADGIASGEINRRVQGGSVQTLHDGTGIRPGAKAPGCSAPW
jgi:hypothetical protein